MKFPSRYLNEYLRKTTPTHAHIKKWAHAATVAFAALIVPSLCAIYFRSAGIREEEPYWISASMIVWKIQGAVAAAAIILWIFEKPRRTKYEPVEPIDAEDDLAEAPIKPPKPTRSARG
jgi:hypothetical protein